MPKEDYRLSIYLGSGKEGRTLRYRIDQACAEDRFNRSPMNFVRYAIRYTLEHDVSIKSEMPRVGT